eukprot:TRINITY_DN21480_c0_g1_i1.p1 TRINITY_DN21480_c0_g1~~TRINITY_DN21480_c0_g1_i1.p1  ORF type:complete len:722 (+),score=190.75 TRINITY_DN21480_c0_g1_i1:59-2224(+)
MPISCLRDPPGAPQVLLSAARAAASPGGLHMSTGTAVPPPPEVVAEVAFEIGEHGGKMKVSMVDGNTAGSVVAYCCAALSDRLGVDLVPAEFMLAVLPHSAAKDGGASAGYLHGLNDVLGHPQVRAALEDGCPVVFDLRPLPENHPQGMYIEDRPFPPPGEAADARYPPGGGAPLTGGYAATGYGAARAALDQAMTEEVERELSMMDWYRPGGGPPGSIGPASSAARAAGAGGASSGAFHAQQRLARARDSFARSAGDASLPVFPPHPVPRHPTGDLDVTTDAPHDAASRTVPMSGGERISSPPLRPAEPAKKETTPLVAPAQPRGEMSGAGASFALAPRAAEMLRTERDELKAALARAQQEGGAHAETAKALLKSLDAAKEENRVLVREAAEASAAAKAKRVDEAELQELRDALYVLRRDHERAQEDLRRSEGRERKLQDEILALQKELTKEAAKESSALERLLPTLVAAVPAVIPPPPVTMSPQTPLKRFACHTQIGEEVVLSAKKLVASPGSPEIFIDPEDSLGTIVAKLTGKAALGAEVDQSLRTPLLVDGEGEGGVAAEEGSCAPLLPDEEVQVTPLRLRGGSGGGAEDGGLQARLVALARAVETLPDPHADGTSAALKQAMLRQVTEIRSVIAPPTEAPGDAPHQGAPGGPGSPGGPLRSASTYSYPASLGAAPGGYAQTAYVHHGGAMHAVPQGPPSAGESGSVYSMPTRPPGI